MNHDSLAQIPVNSVLIGLFTEALNTITTPGTKYPEYITIQGNPAANTSSRTYKFKSMDVLKYLEGLNQMIEIALTNFVPNENELATGTISPSFVKSPVVAPNKSEVEGEPEAKNKESQLEIADEEKTDAENTNDAVAELEDVDEQIPSQSQEESPTKIMSGGKQILAKRFRKISLKKKK